MWSDLAYILLKAGAQLVGPLFRALRDGDADRAAKSARIVAETIFFKRGLKGLRR